LEVAKLACPAEVTGTTARTVTPSRKLNEPLPGMPALDDVTAAEKLTLVPGVAAAVDGDIVTTTGATVTVKDCVCVADAA
jgi:hypothetical protein